MPGCICVREAVDVTLAEYLMHADRRVETRETRDNGNPRAEERLFYFSQCIL
jgi:hypothetical protein